MSPRTVRLLACLATMVMAEGIHEPPRAQVSDTCAIEGRILDDTGSPMPGVLVTLTSATAAIPPSMIVSDLDGKYAFRLLPRGNDYMLKATVQDYATVIAGPVELVPGRTTRLDVTLKRSSELEETIRVEAHGEIVDTTSATAVTSYNAEFIEGLPLVGRSFADVLTLAPGVTDTDGDGNPNVRGARDTGLQLRLDGSNVTNPLSGHMGQDVNLESIDQVDIITAAAPAEYSRADGGFANVITKSGGNDFDGSFKLFYRSNFLDGDGAGTDPGALRQFTDVDSYLTVGGPIVRDHLWYFASMERLDEEIPVVLPSGGFALQTREGWRGFGKMTWQVDAANRLAFQINYDPVEYGGNNIGPVIDPETDYLQRAGGPLPQFTWTAVLTPTLLLQFMLSRLNGNLEIDPVSDNYARIPVSIRETVTGDEVIALPCVSYNCQNEPNLRQLRIPAGRRGASGTTAFESGPYNQSTNQDLTRTTMRSDLSYTVEEMAGQHSFKSGFEYALESYAESGVTNPILTNRTCTFAECGTRGTTPPAGTLGGTILLEAFDPPRRDMSAE